MTAVAMATHAAEEREIGRVSAGEPLAMRGVGVRYGRREILSSIDLAVPAGEVYALLGRNGSGKSSLVRVLLGLQRPSAGEVLLLGRDPWRHRHRLMAEVGFVPEDSPSPPEMTARALLSFCRRLRGRGDERAAVARLERFGVPLGLPFRRLSKGQRKQVELTLALAHGPSLLVLDDPSLGLDPLARRALFGELMAELAEQGTTVLLTTHDLEAVEGVATRVGLLAGGHLLLDEPLESVKARFRTVRVAARREAELRPWRPLRRAVRAWGIEVVVAGWPDPAPPGFEARAMSLEEIFAALLEGSEGGSEGGGEGDGEDGGEKSTEQGGDERRGERPTGVATGGAGKVTR